VHKFELGRVFKASREDDDACLAPTFDRALGEELPILCLGHHCRAPHLGLGSHPSSARAHDGARWWHLAGWPARSAASQAATLPA